MQPWIALLSLSLLMSMSAIAEPVLIAEKHSSIETLTHDEVKRVLLGRMFIHNNGSPLNLVHQNLHSDIRATIVENVTG